MKAKLLTISAAVMALLAVSCQREETGFGLPAGEEVTVTLSASVPTGGPAVKSDTEPGNGDQINRCILGVYMVTDESSTELYGTLEYEGVGTDGTATFEDVTLLTGYDYKLVFWADNVASTTNLQTDNHYVTTDFPTVTYNTADGHQYMSSDDTRDAFYGVFDLTDFSGEVADSYTLTRPFGQLNIFTTDYDDIKMEALKPAKVQMAFTSIPTGMDLINGSLTEPAEGAGGVTGEISDIPRITNPVVTGAKQLSFDYIFAPAGHQLMLKNIEMAFYDASDSQLSIDSYTFPELPVQRNYRTNVSGALLTKSADLTIDIRKNFAGIKDVNLHEVSTIEEVEKTLNEIADMGANVQPESVVFTFSDELDDTENSNTIELPALTTEVVLDFDGGISSAGLTVKDDSDASNFTGNVIIRNAGEDAVPLTIDLPGGSVELKSGNWSSIYVTTADNTFVVGSDVEIENLTIRKGSLKLYGRITGTLTKADGYDGKVYRCLSDQTSMDNLIADNYSGYEEVLVEVPADVDGKNTTLSVPVEITSDAKISNLIFKPSEDDKVVNVVSIYGENNDVTIDNCMVHQYYNGDGKTITTSGIIVGGNSQNVTISNSKVILSSAAYYQRGINISEAENATVTVDNTRVGVSEEPLLDDYTEQQISDFKKRVDTRGISMHLNKGNTVLNILNNTLVEGVFYAVNWAGASEKTTVYVENSCLDGRCALNINNGNDNTVRVVNSILKGRNYFTGPTENFAVIVYGYDCEGTDVSVTGNSEIISYNSPQTATNWQFSASLRSPNCGLSLHDVTIREKKTGDVEPRMSFAVDDQYPESNTITSSNVSFDGKEYLQLLPSTVWDGSLKNVPMQTLVKMTDEYQYQAYVIIQPSDLAWVAENVNSGDEEARKMSLWFERDIDLGGYSWVPIGYNEDDDMNMGEADYAASPMFSGSVFGNGYTIKNAVVDVQTTARGVFGQVFGDPEAENPTYIFDLNAENIQLKKAGKWSGGLFGYIRNVTAISGCSIKDVTIETGKNPTSYFCGGLIGYVTSTDDITIVDCASENVTFPGPETWNCGGLIGKIYGCKDVLIENCEASRGYMKSAFYLDGNMTGNSGTYKIAKDGYQNSWFIGNLTNKDGFNLVIKDVPDNSKNWTESDSKSSGEIPVEVLKEGAFSWPYIGVFDGYSDTTTATITIDGKKVFPVETL